MLTFLLLLTPFLGGLVTFGIKGRGARAWALTISIATLILTGVTAVFFRQDPQSLGMDVPWITQLGSRFHIGLDGMGMMLCLLTALAFVIVFLASYRHTYHKPHSFYGLMLLTQAGLMGVFT